MVYEIYEITKRSQVNAELEGSCHQTIGKVAKKKINNIKPIEKKNSTIN